MNSDIYNANLVTYHLAELLRIPVLYTQKRVSAATIHFDLCHYELRALHNPERGFYLESSVSDDFAGTVISATPILLDQMDRFPLMGIEVDALRSSTEEISLASYEARYGS